MTDSQKARRSDCPGDNSTKANTFRELVANLSDGVLTAEEALQFNTLLKSDPIAQELYLDHILIDGLLQFEIGAAIAPQVSSILSGEREVESAATRTFGWPLSPQSLPTLALVSVVLAVGVLSGGWFSRFVGAPDPALSTRLPLRFADPGFEGSAPLPSSVAVSGRWFGDLAEVVGTQSGITPAEGERMLRFVKSRFEPDYACDLYQVVDLTPMSTVIATGRCSVDASALFNAIPHEDNEGYAFAVTLFACVKHPLQQQQWPLTGMRQLSVSGQQIPADSVAESWQVARTHLPLPEDTTHLLVQVSAVRLYPSTVESPLEAGHFVDNLEVALVTRK